MKIIRSKQAGFTLIELVIAMAIFASISIFSYKAIDQFIQSKNHIDLENQKWQQLMLFFDRFEADIRQHANRPMRNQYAQTEPAWYAVPYFSGQYGAQLALSRLGDAKQTDFLMDTRRVGYRLDHGAIETLIWPALDLAAESTPEVFKLVEHVADFKLSYLNQNGQWIQNWPEPSIQLDMTNYYPRAVSLNIMLRSGEAIVRIFSL